MGEVELVGGQRMVDLIEEFVDDDPPVRLDMVDEPSVEVPILLRFGDGETRPALVDRRERRTRSGWGGRRGPRPPTGRCPATATSDPGREASGGCRLCRRSVGHSSVTDSDADTR